MKIVIDIPDEIYQDIQNQVKDVCDEVIMRLVAQRDNSTPTVFRAIQNGTPLPKGHGRLIDADALLDKKQDYGEGQQKLILIDPYFIRKAPTIIEADDELEL